MHLIVEDALTPLLRPAPHIGEAARPWTAHPLGGKVVGEALPRGLGCAATTAMAAMAAWQVRGVHEVLVDAPVRWGRAARWEASGQMDGSSPIQDFINWTDGAQKTPHPTIVIYMFELYKDAPDMLNVASKRLNAGTAVETGGTATVARRAPATDNTRPTTRRRTGLTGEDLAQAFGTSSASDRTQAAAAMISARANQRMAQATGINTMLSHRANLTPTLQQQLDDGIGAYMAQLFGGAAAARV
jgi:hypothetical protein